VIAALIVALIGLSLALTLPGALSMLALPFAAAGIWLYRKAVHQ
jgi:hypothetical protein